jgi:hypothetical protein
VVERSNNQGDIMPLLLELAPGQVASAAWKQVLELQQNGLPTPVPHGLQSKSDTHIAGHTPAPDDELELPLEEPLEEDELEEDELEDEELEEVLPDDDAALASRLVTGSGLVPLVVAGGSTSSAELHAYAVIAARTKAHGTRKERTCMPSR